MEEFVSKDVNTILSKLNDNDKKEYVDVLDNFEIGYEDTLNISDYNAFGLEVEYEEIYKAQMDYFVLKNLDKWFSKEERDFTIGGEVISPILNDNKKTWEDLKKLCEYLKNKNALMDGRAGGHIHFSSKMLGSNIENWKNFLFMYSAFENIIYRFSYGDRVNGREFIIANAYPISIELSRKYEDIKCCDDISKLYKIIYEEDRFAGLNLYNVKWDNLDKEINKNTIEFRMPNGTDEEVIWQNNVYFFTKLLLSYNKEIDEDLLRFYIFKNKERYSYVFFNKVNLNQAFYLADMIFDNNYDKMKFMKQYYKDGSVSRGKYRTVYSSKKLIK